MRTLVITAHPDDVDFGAGGTIASWTSQGIEVSYCIVTDGDAGGFDPAVPRSEIPAIRHAEQIAAGRQLGVEEVRFLGWQDGRVEPTTALRIDLSRVIRQVRPERIVTHNPERNWDRIGASHPDHLAVGEATVRAVYPDARNPFAYPELADLEAHTVGEVWLMGGPGADTWVDVTDSFERKLAALREHTSQETDRGGGLEARLREWMSATAAQAGYPDGRLAEGFRRVITR
ncbi:PIG-L family deacetylase [Acidiferrimicrobium sp. IK]|uniref:PIG-L deacetylase family protein n=1 Tax=Acidiferrimicrobium sp. IK TaxID=2871700 RepID=UPI0021CB1A66|nr:PIG-L deacetylase family protein [Acidiferrimicrobium sp. IK]MCU4184920.1 PIG-L family deacetylase [Acidiferrimicrobium sp. IK]